MKKIFLFGLLFFNIFPNIKEGSISCNELFAQSEEWGEELEDIRYPNGFHLVLWDDGHYSHYWEDIAEGMGPGQNGQTFWQTGPPNEFEHDNELGNPEDLIDPDDDYWHIYHKQQEYLYDWDPIDRQWQIQIPPGNGSPGAKPKYYLTVNNHPHRYYNGDKIYIKRQGDPIILKVFDENGSAINPMNFAWKRTGATDTTKCISDVVCDVIKIHNTGQTFIRIDSSGTTIIKNPLVVTDKPMIVFQRGASYTGDYGFDDSSHRYIFLRTHEKYSRGLQVGSYGDDTSYVVPWMSVLPQQQYGIKIKKINVDSSLASDPNFWVEFRTTSNKISINYSPYLHLNYAQLESLNDLIVSCNAWRNDSMNVFKKNQQYDSLLKYVYVITNTGDTIGKLNLTCSNPEPKQIVFVYVNTGSGYNTSLQKQPMLDFLNLRSHNQIFRKWVLNTSYSDTLDVSYEYNANATSFSDPDLMPQVLRGMYNQHKGINIGTINFPYLPDKPEKIHFLFIMNDSYIDSTYSGPTLLTNTTYGVAPMGSYYGVIFGSGNVKTVGHELGHILNLYHVFDGTEGTVPSGYPYYIPKYNTKNFMDYVPVNGINNLDMFYYTQWIDCL